MFFVTVQSFVYMGAPRSGRLHVRSLRRWCPPMRAQEGVPGALQEKPLEKRLWCEKSVKLKANARRRDSFPLNVPPELLGTHVARREAGIFFPLSTSCPCKSPCVPYRTEYTCT